jgi:hypothetical protein
MADRSRSAVPQLEDRSPSPQPSPTDALIPPTPTRPTGPLAFAEPTVDPSPSQPEADSSSEDDTTSDEDPAAPSPSRPTSSTASSGNSSPFAKPKIREATRRAVIALGDLAHDRLARDRAAQQAELWRADDDDAENIGDPLAEAAHRHMGELGEFNNPDVGDLIAAGIGIAVYLFKQLDKARTMYRLRRQALEQPQAPAEPAVAGHESREQPQEPPADLPAPAAPAGPGTSRYGL